MHIQGLEQFLMQEPPLLSCPTCKQSLPVENAQEISKRLEEDKAKAKAEIRDRQLEIAAHERSLEAINVKTNEIVKLINEIEDKLTEFNNLQDSLNSLYEQRQRYVTEFDAWDRALALREKALGTAAPSAAPMSL